MAKALVTGASSGIGRDIARELAMRGYSLILSARREERLLQLKKELEESYKVGVEIVVQDLDTPNGAAELFEKVSSKGVTLLVNNAGFGTCGRFAEIPLEKEVGMIDLNIRSTHILMKLFVRHFIKEGGGTVLNVASSAGFFPGPLMAAYYASKAYVLRLTRAVSEELRRDKIPVFVCALCPGPVATEFDSRADVRFSMKSLSSEYTARYAVKMMLKGKKVIVPGAQMKLVRFFSRLLPESLLVRFAYKAQSRKKQDR